MVTLELQIIQSTHNPNKVSLRPLNRAGSELRAELTQAGFRPGDRVVVIRKEEYQRLVRAASHSDETVENSI